MPAPIALQLYTVRDALSKDFAGVINRVAEIGYVGVETAGFPGTSVKDAARHFRELGLVVTSQHIRIPMGEKQQEILDAAAEVGSERLVCSFFDPADLEGVDKAYRFCDSLNEANVVAQANGLSLGVHNHWWEFEPFNGTTAYDIMRERLDQTIFFELDTYWIQTAGVDPVAIVRQAGSRAPLLHIKDGSTAKDDPMVAVGDGIMDYPAIIEASAGSAEWLIVELDRCATDMLQAAAGSYQYLTGSGLARGKR